MSNRIFQILDESKKFRESVKTKKISSPNNDEYTKWHEEWAKEKDEKGGYIPPNKDFSEEIFCRDD